MGWMIKLADQKDQGALLSVCSNTALIVLKCS
jgi:hypothetical protein